MKLTLKIQTNYYIWEMHRKDLVWRSKRGTTCRQAARGDIPLGGREQGQHPGMGLETPSARAGRDLPELCSQQDTGNAVGDHEVLALTGLFSGFRGALG